MLKNVFVISLLLVLCTVYASDFVKEISFGKEVDITRYVIQGKLNIFDFYSPFCGPCMAIAPALEKLAETDSSVNVVKVNINRPEIKGIDWKSPVVAQYKIRSVPHFKVFNRDGIFFEGDGARNIVEQLITPLKTAVYRDQIMKNPGDPMPLYNRAMHYLKSKDYERAIADFTRILKLNDSAYIVYYNLACAYSLNNQKKRAVKTLARSLELAKLKNDVSILNSFIQDPDFNNIKDTAEFIELASQY